MDIRERTLLKLVETINRHLPEKRRSLEELLKMEDPEIRGRDGIDYYIERKELEFIASYVDEFDRGRFMIPIILEMANLGGDYVIYVRDKLHARFIEKAFGFDRYVNDTLMLYSYELQRIRKVLKTTSQIMFRP